MHGSHPKRAVLKHICWLIVALCVMSLQQFAVAQEFSTKVIAVLDGDTVLIRRGNGVQKIRLAEIDAPEVSHAGGQTPGSQQAQPYGELSKRSLSEMVLGKQVLVVSEAVDRYGRMVAHLFLNGLDVNAEQIRTGMAWEYSHYHGNKALVALETDARQAGRGLWASSLPTPPWDWRRLHPDTYNKSVRSEVLPHPPSAAACSPRKHCSVMTSCEEARRYMQLCGAGTMDGDGDGVPCESLCNASKSP